MAESAEVHELPSNRLFATGLPRNEFPAQGMPARDAYELIHLGLMVDGQPSMNLASFVTTWMEPEAETLIHEASRKNHIDHEEYPVADLIEEVCVRMLADLFHAPDPTEAVGVATIGSSEAIMLGLLAHKFSWRNRREEAGLPDRQAQRRLRRRDPRRVGQVRQLLRRRDAQDPDAPRPLRDAPRRRRGRRSTRTPSPSARCSARPTSARTTRSRRSTTCSCGSRPRRAGTSPCTSTAPAAGSSPRSPIPTSSGTSASSRSRRSTRRATSTGSSTRASAGWCSATADKLPEDLVFSVNYLGGAQPTFTFNFSRGRAMIQAQFYNFLRLGRSGYKAHRRQHARPTPGTSTSELGGDRPLRDPEPGGWPSRSSPSG